MNAKLIANRALLRLGYQKMTPSHCGVRSVARRGSSMAMAKNVRLVQGKVEETIPNTIPDSIAILRLDTDC